MVHNARGVIASASKLSLMTNIGRFGRNGEIFRNAIFWSFTSIPKQQSASAVKGLRFFLSLLFAYNVFNTSTYRFFVCYIFRKKRIISKHVMHGMN